MKLKISTPAQVVFEGEVNKVDIPTENGIVSISAGHIPMVTSIKPGLIGIWSEQSYMQADSESFISTSKGMAFVDGKIVRIVTAEATSNPDENTETLQQIKDELEDRIAILKTTGSVEEIEKNIIKLEKVNADIQLKEMNNQ